GRADVASLIVLLSAWWLPSTAQQRHRAERAILLVGVVLALFGVWNYFGPRGWTNWADGVGLVDFRVNVLKAATFQPVERVAVVACLVLTALASFGNAGGQLRSGVDPNDPRTSAHITALGRSAGRVLTHPLGSGLGSASAIAIRFNVKNRFENTENFYLLFGIEVGLVGTLLFVAFVVSVSRLVWRRSAFDTRGPLVGAAAGIAAIAVGGIVLDTFGEMPA